MAGKRGNGEGSITQRADGRWMARFPVVDGTRRTLYGKTRKDVAGKLRTALKSQDEGVLAPTGRRTVEQFLLAWLASVESSLQPTTYRRYEQYVKLQAIPELGKLQLRSLGPEHLQRLYKTWIDRRLSPTSVGHLHTVLHAALAQAVKLGYVPRNVTDLVRKPKAARHEMRTLSADESRRLLDAAGGDRFEALYVLALSTGLRQGELLALRWQDVHLERALPLLQVRGTLQPTREGLRIAPPKTRSSTRQVQLTGVAVEALKRHKLVQNGERLRLGAAWQDNDYVFANEVGGAISASNLMNRSYKPLLKRAHVPTVRFHDLRHTTATLLLEKGTHPKIVSEMLGHSSIAITLDLYSHVTQPMHEQATASMDEILGSSHPLPATPSPARLNRRSPVLRGEAG